MEKLEQIITTYQQIIQKTELELQNARKRIYYISLLRLILFVGAVANAIIFWSDGWLCLSAFAVLPFILFIWLVKRHNFWFYRKDFLKKKIEINEQELRAIQYDFSDFDDGKEFINPSHLYTLDLDVFGEHSLFQYINRTATPIGKGFRSINVQLRQRFNTYANLRPVRTLPGVPTRFENVDLVIVRENTEDLYKGIEYMLNDEIANGVKLITKPACERICRFAFGYAAANGRKKVTAVHKANIMKLTDGMFLSTFREVAKDYPAIEADDCIIDALCMKLVQKPEQFDVLVAPNLYGDIISDLCAGLVGGLGFAPSANIGAKTRIYEAVHGSAPDIAGQNKANPSAILMAFAMMLNDLGMTDKAARLNAAILAQVAEGKAVTADIGGTATTTEFTDAVAARL